MNRRGIALVVVMIAMTLILFTIVSTTRFQTIGTRSGVMSEKVAYQALLVAESGLDSLNTRLAGYKGNAAGMATQINSLGSFAVGPNSSVTLFATASGEIVTVQATGSVPKGSTVYTPKQDAYRQVVYSRN